MVIASIDYAKIIRMTKTMITRIDTDKRIWIDDLSDAVRDYILKHYSPRKMIDQIIICNKSRGIITCNIEHDDMQLADNTLEEVNNE